MSSSFQNPRNPLVALWASATESYMRDTHPDLSIREIRRLPFMQGVYEHLSQLKLKQRVPKPPEQVELKETGDALKTAQAAYYSQAFFDVAVTGIAYSQHPYDPVYLLYIEGLEVCHELDGTTNFSTEDWFGFGLCVIVYIRMSGVPTDLGTMEKRLIDFLISNSGLTSEQKKKIKDFWHQPFVYGMAEFQYRDANSSAYKNYGVMDWKIPDNAQIVMIGDWGTSMDDAAEFLEQLWKKAYLNNPEATILFLHLGDIYYCGLPYECYYYFLDVFAKVGAKLQRDPSIDPNKFNPNPPIFTIPGNHEYYSYGYGYFELLDNLGQGQSCSFFCLRTKNNQWQFLGIDTGQADGNGLLSFMQGMGDIVEGCLNKLPNWGWVNWITNLAVTTYEDFVGPFQPTLRDSEFKWVKDKLDHFDGKTIMLSHHQLFSRRAEIDHNTPQYMNSWLDENFSCYYDKIAAWYWGHEHTFAVYLDGVMGLNKGRLLGSSSYEVTNDSDDPYGKTYPMVPFASYMDQNLIDQTKGIYSHVGAIMSQQGSEIGVNYYQFEAWSQLDEPPVGRQLKEIPEVAEKIAPTSFTSLKPSWIGDIPIKAKEVKTSHSPSVAVWDESLYLAYVDKKDNKNELKLCNIKTSDIHLENRQLKGAWSNANFIKNGNSNITSDHSPALIAVDSRLFLFYIDKSNILRGLTRYTNGSEWTSLSLEVKVGDAAPAVCFFQGRIYLVYREKGSDDNLFWGFYDIASGYWQDFGELKASNNKKLESPNTPALAADAYNIYMTYQKKDGNSILWAVGHPAANDVPEAYINNISWLDQGEVEGKHKTETGMSLAYANGIFIMVYTLYSESGSNGNLMQCALNGTGKDSFGSWVGDNIVKPYNQKGYSTARSKFVAELGITTGGGVMVYRGLDHEEIYWAYY